MNDKKIKELVEETTNFVGMTNNRLIIKNFLKTQFKIAYLDGQQDGLEKARRIYNEDRIWEK